MNELDQLTLHFDQDNLLLMNACLAFIMFGVALELGIYDFKNLFKNPRALLVGLFCQVILLPALTFMLILGIQPTVSIALGMIMVASCPGGSLSNLLSVVAKGNAALSVSLTSITTLLASITLPINFHFWSQLYVQENGIGTVQVDMGSLMFTLLVTVLLPLTAGMLFKQALPSLTERIRRAVRLLSFLIFLAFIIISFAANFNYFLSYIHILFFIVLAHNGIAYMGGYALATVSGLDGPSRRTITLDTGLQNSGLALVLIFNFFPTLGGMAFLAGWWAIWDMISSILLAWTFSYWHKPKKTLMHH